MGRVERSLAVLLLVSFLPWVPATAEDPETGPGDPAAPRGLIDVGTPAQHAFRDWPPRALRERPYWNAWSREAFQRATLFGRPVFFLLTVDWNRAAQQFEQETLAKQEVLLSLNARYLTIEVNADLRPDIRERYQTGAWPAAAFLLPNGQPMLSQAEDLSAARPITMTAVSPEALLFLLEQGTVYWDGWTGVLLEAGDYWVKQEGARRPTGGAANLNASDLVARNLLASADRVGGGFGAFPKYVRPAVDEYASLRQARGNGELREHTRLTLERFVASPLFDPVDGGVHRAAAALSFQDIQYEKMLESNSALVRELTFGLRGADSPELREALEATSRFIVDGLGRPEGGFWLAQMADSRSPDGGGYWQAEPGQRPTPPPVDRIVLAGPTTLAGAALLRAGMLLDDDEFVHAGRAAVEFVHDRAYHPGRGVTHAIEPGGDTRIYLVAQADAALGFADAFETTGDPRFLEAARRVVEFVQANLADPRLAAMRDGLVDPLAVGLLRNPRWPPRANVRLARAMIRLSWHGLDEPLREQAMQILTTYCEDPTTFGVHGTELALAIEEGLAEPLQIRISGPAGATETLALRRAAVNSPWPWTIVQTAETAEARPAAHVLWQGKKRRVDRAEALHAAIGKLTAKARGGRP